MIVTIMQPYFFPYIGYFQLLECSDIFVVYDDVQYIKGGWINRNNILLNNKPYLLTFPVQQDSIKLFINQRNYVNNQSERNAILYKIKMAYQAAPYFECVYPVLLEIMSFNSNNVSEFNTNSIEILIDFLKIKCKIIVSSELEKDRSLKSTDRVIEINSILGSSHYVNLLGGIDLYQEKNFVERGIELSFIKLLNIQYHQFSQTYYTSLSIIDTLMFCTVDEVKDLLKKYRLIKREDFDDQIL